MFYLGKVLVRLSHGARTEFGITNGIKTSGLLIRSVYLIAYYFPPINCNSMKSPAFLVFVQHLPRYLQVTGCNLASLA